MKNPYNFPLAYRSKRMWHTRHYLNSCNHVTRKLEVPNIESCGEEFDSLLKYDHRVKQWSNQLSSAKHFTVHFISDLDFRF